MVGANEDGLGHTQNDEHGGTLLVEVGEISHQRGYGFVAPQVLCQRSNPINSIFQIHKYHFFPSPASSFPSLFLCVFSFRSSPLSPGFLPSPSSLSYAFNSLFPLLDFSFLSTYLFLFLSSPFSLERLILFLPPLSFSHPFLPHFFQHFPSSHPVQTAIISLILLLSVSHFITPLPFTSPPLTSPLPLSFHILFLSSFPRSSSSAPVYYSTCCPLCSRDSA